MDAQPHVPLTTGAGRGTRRWGGLVTVAALCLLGSASPTAAAIPPSGDLSGQTSQAAVPVAESWYRPLSPTCGTAVGCLPVSPSALYPADTLHVGVAAGQEESRSFISLALPGSTELRGGTLTLPVGSSSDGTVQADAAKVRACLVTGVVKDHVEGDIGNRPGADCSTSSPAVAKTSAAGTVLSVDLAPFVSEWAGAPLGSLALVPAADVAQTDVWHLAFSRHDRKGTGVVPISATILVESDLTPEDVPSAPAEPETPGTSGLPPVIPVASVPAISPGNPPQVAPVPEQSAPPAPTVAGSNGLVPAAQSVDTSFAYPGVFLLPPLLLLALAWFARAFTRDLAEEQK